ncbi:MULTISPECIES: hypothetical protein [Burkholderia]|uniref:Uncharacterized protein n=1 Tax=Burkholderia mayonis TaxID=1385591 RepID=A0A1B4FPH1_9BURK|nr:MULTISPECIES: hypothetical protein [Burkholderia]AOJ05566.1 hypothetical protein WS70_28300 [Burkholderia mayonis]KVE34718.1 hypothetical protein WS69_16245 [Burkholderia sp. BDU5]KVE47718.1 hypothetical protein WS70_24460 [Burkholderia mayonis]
METSVIRQPAAQSSVAQRIIIGALIAGLGIFSVGDHFYHVRNGILWYNWAPRLDGQSLIVWPIFVAGSAAILAATHPLTSGTTPPPLPKLVSLVTVTHLVYGATGLFGNTHPFMLSITLVALWIVRIATTTDYRMRIAVLSVIVAATGPLAEGLVSWLGLFDYKLQQFARVPYWLFAAYLHAGPLAFTFGRWVRNGRLGGAA